MGQFVPRDPPQQHNADFLRQEFQRVARAVTDPFNLLQLDVLHVEPTRLRECTIAAADGVDWEPVPGQGGGVFAYYGGSWKKLG